MSAPTDRILRACTTGDGETRAVTLDRRFQGLPDTAHGGTVLALFDALAPAPHGARALAGVYRRRVPLDTPLRLAISRDATRFQLADGAALLVQGTVTDAGAPAAPSAGAAPARSPDAMTLPLAKMCFACGTENPLGLHARLTIDDDVIGGTWMPRAELGRDDGTLAPIALTALLDEAAYWLGAAASGESGMTTDLRIQLRTAAVALGPQIVVAGRRATVRQQADDPRYWDTEVLAWDESGRLLARASITFVAVRGAARKLVAGFLSVATPDVVHRVFPAYVPDPRAR
jgi:hypothetical protein